MSLMNQKSQVEFAVLTDLNKGIKVIVFVGML
jgi:hypothetical protein